MRRSDPGIRPHARHARRARDGTRIAQGLHMFASLIRTALLLSGQAGSAGADVDALDTFWLLLCFACLIFGGLWLLVKFVPFGTKPPQSTQSSYAPAAAIPRSRRTQPSVAPQTPRALRPIPRRVIRLHAVTPGQSQHEYNVGDPLGTRGSALARVA
jgi:hypothetical protein